MEITALFIYPVKSCRGVSVDQVELGPRGFLHDREFLVVDEEDAFITQRTAPELATVEMALAGSGLILKNPNARELHLRLGKEADRGEPRPTRTVKIFRDEVIADDVGDEAAEWFTVVLQRPARLVQLGASSSRRVKTENIAPAHRGAEGPEIPFTDGFPILLTSEESLADLNSRLPEPLPMNRFRPNIVVRGSAPYEEDRWNRVRSREIVFGCAAPDLRCVITTIDQQTGTRTGVEPLRTLATYRRASDGGGVMFGQYLIAHNGAGTLRVGEELLPDFLPPESR